MSPTGIALLFITMAQMAQARDRLSDMKDAIVGKLDMHRIVRLHDPEDGNFFGHGTRGNWTWSENYQAVTAQGHRWCKLQRDNWSCVGERYAEVLSQTPTYDTSLTLSALPTGTAVFAEGNSFFAEHVTQIVCNTKEIVVHHGRGNDMLAYIRNGDVTLLLLDNDIQCTHS